MARMLPREKKKNTWDTLPYQVVSNLNKITLVWKLRLCAYNRCKNKLAPRLQPDGAKTSRAQIAQNFPPAKPSHMQSMLVTVPPGVLPGQQLQVQVGQQQLLIPVPQGVVPGQQLQFNVPAPPVAQAQADTQPLLKPEMPEVWAEGPRASPPCCALM